MGVIYLIKNTINNKKYIGQTIQDPKKRLQQHINAAYEQDRRTYNTCLSRAIRKYGRDVFKMGILADNVPDDDLDMIEAHYIDMYETTNSKIGYNISSGYRDLSLVKDKRSESPEDNYSDRSEVVIDHISDEDVEQFLREL